MATKATETKTAAFDPAQIVPASKSKEFSAAGNAQRSSKAILLAGITKQIKMFNDPSVEGRAWFKAGKSEVALTLRIASRQLKLAGEETRVVVPLDAFEAAMNYYKEQVEAGAFDDQLTEIDSKRSARLDKLRETRAKK